MAGIFNPTPEIDAARKSITQADNRLYVPDPMYGSPNASGYLPTIPQTGLPGYFGDPSDPRNQEELIPAECVWWQIAIAPSRIPAGFNDRDYMYLVNNVLTKAEIASLNAAELKFHTTYPWMPSDWLELHSTATVKRPISADASKNTMIYHLMLLRKKYPAWDPIQLRFPVIEPTDPRAPVFEASLRLFFPDYVYQKGGSTPGALLRSGKSGSMTPDGPFPYWLKFVSSRQIDAVVKYVKTFPNAFGMPQQNLDDAGRDAVLTVAKTAQGALIGTKILPGIGTIAGAAVGFASGIVEFFSDLFGGDPEPPAWLKAILKITAETRSSSFNSIVAGSGTFRSPDWPCHRLVMRVEGQYDMFQAYDEFYKRLGGGGATGGMSWLWLALGAAGLYIAS